MYGRSEPENFDVLLDAIRNYKDGSFRGPDASLDVSLLEYHYVARPTDDVEDAWTVILYVPELMPGGPGFKLETFHLRDLESWFFDVFNAYKAYGIEDPEVFWDFSGTDELLQLYVQNCDMIFQPSHYFDEPLSAEELAELLRDR
jgi:hypothetical protein